LWGVFGWVCKETREGGGVGPVEGGQGGGGGGGKIISQDLSIPLLLSEVYKVVKLLSFYLRLFHVQKSFGSCMIESLHVKFLLFFSFNF